MGKKEGTVQETPEQRAVREIGIQKITRFRERYQPLMRRAAANITRAGESGSFEREHGAGLALADNAARFAGADDAATAAAAGRGALGGSGQKLAIAGLGLDQATSAGAAAVRADQARDDATAAGLGSIVAAGQGQESTALQGLSTAADISGRAAANDAQMAMERRIGQATQVGQVAGMAAGAYANSGPGLDTAYDYNYRGTELPRSLRGGQ